ncbi:uncharacterized protein LOC134206122 [Armigeres subalbatus]|uniref:uncharacterized protein LOC134206122 n=1 Tax=Armigeres subalbatus TaxID=124917 RepID=UPI002ED0A427
MTRPSSKKCISASSEKKPLNNLSSSKLRPSTSFASTSPSYSSKLSFKIDDELQRGVHRLGQLPSYLRKKDHPSKVTSKLKSAESNAKQPLARSNTDPNGFLKKSTRQVAGGGVIKERSVRSNKILERAVDIMNYNQVESSMQTECPFFKSRIFRFPALQASLLLEKDIELDRLRDKIRYFQEKYNAYCERRRLQESRILILQTELASKDEVIKKLQTTLKTKHALLV